MLKRWPRIQTVQLMTRPRLNFAFWTSMHITLEPNTSVNPVTDERVSHPLCLLHASLSASACEYLRTFNLPDLEDFRTVAGRDQNADIALIGCLHDWAPQIKNFILLHSDFLPRPTWPYQQPFNKAVKEMTKVERITFTPHIFGVEGILSLTTLIEMTLICATKHDLDIMKPFLLETIEIDGKKQPRYWPILRTLRTNNFYLATTSRNALRAELCTSRNLTVLP